MSHGGDVYRYPNVVDFSANINFLGMPQAVREAAMRGVEESVHYPQADHSELKYAVAAHYGVPCDCILCGNGAAELIYAMVHALKPRKALLPAPTFSEYEQALTACGCEVSHFLLKKENAFGMEDEFIEQVTADIDIVFLCTPNNPTGVLTPLPYLQKLLAACERADTMLVVDESFLGFIPDAESVRALLPETSHLIILQSLTKLYAIPGLRLGCAFFSTSQQAQAVALHIPPWNITLPAQYAGIAALSLEDYIPQTQQAILAERTYLYDNLSHIPTLTVYPSAANFLLIESPPALWQHCLNHGYLLRNCSDFIALGERYNRLAVRTHSENTALITCINAM